MTLKYSELNIEKFMDPINLKFINAFTTNSGKRLNTIDDTINPFLNIDALYWDINFKTTNKPCYATININQISEFIPNDTYDIYNGIVYKNNVIVENKTTMVLNNNINVDISIPPIINNEIGINYFYIKIVSLTAATKFRIIFNNVKLYYEDCEEIDTTWDIIHSREIPAVYYSGIINISNVKSLYKEFIIVKDKKGYNYKMSFIEGNIGLNYNENKITFFLSDTKISDTYSIPSEIVQLNNDTIVDPFNTSLGINIYLNYPLKINEKYGLMLKSHTIDRPRTVKYPFGKVTYISVFFINLGDINSPINSPTWVYIGTLRNYYDFDYYKTRNRFLKLEGIMSQSSQTDGALFTGTAIIGNSWASDGTKWVESESEEYSTLANKEGTGTHNVNITPYDTDTAMIKIQFGGRISGPFFNYSRRTNFGNPVPSHILDLPNQFPFINNMDVLINVPSYNPIYSNYVMTGEWLLKEERILTNCIETRSDGTILYVVLFHYGIGVAITNSDNNVLETYHKFFLNDINTLKIQTKLKYYNYLMTDARVYNFKDFFNINNLELNGFKKSISPKFQLKYSPIILTTTAVDELLPPDKYPVPKDDTPPPYSLPPHVNMKSKMGTKEYILIGFSVFCVIVLILIFIYYYKYIKKY
jgi:hypothetical protein